MKYFGPEYGIAPWKINSPIERILSHRADNSEFWKRLYVLYYRIFDANYYNNGLALIDKYLDINKTRWVELAKSESQRDIIVRDMVYSLHRFGCEFNEYIAYDFYKLNTAGRETFVCAKNRWKYYLYFNGTRNNPIFDNKNLTYQKFAEYIHRRYCFVESVNDKESFLSFQKELETYIVKPVDGSGGRGVIIAQSNEYSIESLMEKYPKGFLAEEIVHNHKEIAKVNQSSLNTIRVVTIRNENDVHILFAFIRFGRNGSVVDNGFRGGILCYIDIETGIVTSTSAKDGRKYIVHPDSNIPLVGLKIPCWEKVKAVAKQLSTIVPECRYVGWDIAVTDSDVVMIEANCKAELTGPQMSTSRGIKADIERLMK